MRPSHAQMSARTSEARWVLGGMGMDDERSNVRSALTLLALLGLSPDQPWSQASSPLLGTRAIMDWIRDEYDKTYAPNTRETIRRFTLHQFVEAGLVVENPDQPDRPVNSPRWCYQISAEALDVVRQFGSAGFEPALTRYRAAMPGLVAQYQQARQMNRIPLTMPDGRPFTLSPGGQNLLLKEMVEQFCELFAPGGEVLYIGDAGDKWAHFEADALLQLGVVVDEHGKMPDLVVYQSDRNWLFLMEAASSHGPVDGTRKRELDSLFEGCTAGLVFVSCFPTRAEMRRYLTNIAWESEVWCADNPTHLIHFNGDRFLGPH